MSKLNFYKCAHFLLFLSLSTFFIHNFHSCTKILTRSQPYCPYSHPDSPYSHPYPPHSLPDSPYSHHSHPDSPHSHLDFPHSHHSPHFIPRFPILAFTNSRAYSKSSHSSGFNPILQKFYEMM